MWEVFDTEVVATKCLKRVSDFDNDCMCRVKCLWSKCV